MCFLVAALVVVSGMGDVRPAGGPDGTLSVGALLHQRFRTPGSCLVAVRLKDDRDGAARYLVEAVSRQEMVTQLPSFEPNCRYISPRNAELELTCGATVVARLQRVAPKPKIAIIIDDLGREPGQFEPFLKLDIPITFSVLPSLPYATTTAETLREHSVEVLLHLPLEPEDRLKIDGPGFLNTLMSRDVLNTHLQTYLDEMRGSAVGINNHMGSYFTTVTNSVSWLVDAIAAHGLFFVDSRTTPETKGFELARKAGLRTAMRDVFLDHEDDLDAVLEQLWVTYQIALHQGFAIAIGHPRQTTAQAIQRWLPAVRHKVRFVVVSALVRKAYGRRAPEPEQAMVRRSSTRTGDGRPTRSGLCQR